PEIVLFLGLVLLNRRSPEMSVPGLLALGLEASRNQWLRGCSPWWLALGWTQSLHALKSGAGHQTAAFARPLERGVFAPAEGSMRLPFVPFPRSHYAIHPRPSNPSP